MSSQNKKDVILQEIIRAYLEENLPVGSSQLNARVDIPASTIRVYFKKLSDEGVLTQLHISGGRIPTSEAMKEYWNSHIDVKTPLNIEDQGSFSKIVEDFGLYCLVGAYKRDTLDEIIEVDERFLIIVIGEERIVLDFDQNVVRFLQQIKGVSLVELKQICVQVGLDNLSQELDHIIAKKILFKKGEVTVLDMIKTSNLPFNFLANGSFLYSLDNGLFFDEVVPDGYMAVKKPVIFKGEESHLFCLGELYTDFESFFKKTKEIE